MKLTLAVRFVELPPANAARQARSSCSSQQCSCIVPSTTRREDCRSAKNNESENIESLIYQQVLRGAIQFWTRLCSVSELAPVRQRGECIPANRVHSTIALASVKQV
jgi:hypothetical protein